MNQREFQEAKDTFQYTRILDSRKPFHKLRKDFIKIFTLDKIAKMKIDEFVQGKQNRESFCYGLERTLDPLGKITGSTCDKFGVYFSEKDHEYSFVSRFGTDYKSAFKNIKQSIIELIEAGNKEDYDAIRENLISPMFKGKILSTYFPNKYLNIFSNEHLDHYLIGLDLDTPELLKKDAIDKRRVLVEFKNNDPVMKSWDLDMFAVFLVTQYPKEPKAQKDEKYIGTQEKELKFQAIEDFTFVDNLSIDYDSTIVNKSKVTRCKGKADYEKEEKRKTKLGDRGEKIVMLAEIDRVIKERGVTEEQAKKLVIRESLENDSAGYDIRSVNPDGTYRYIEVKATTSKVGDMSFFYTINEYLTAQEHKENYYVYIVYEILTKKPKIWVLKNPFIGDQQLKLEPIKFKVNVQTK